MGTLTTAALIVILALAFLTYSSWSPIAHSLVDKIEAKIAEYRSQHNSTPTPTPHGGGGGGGGGGSNPTPTATPHPTTYPTANPTTPPNGENLAEFNDNQWVTDVTWESVPISNIDWENSITYSGALTFKVTPQQGNDNAGADHWGPTIRIGDHIIMSCWMKTGGSSPVSYAGARIGFDVYGADGRITGVHSQAQASDGCRTPSTDYSIDTNYVHWGNGWTLRTWDFIVPSTYISDGGSASINNNYAFGSAVAPTLIIPWIQVWCSNYPSAAYPCYFSDFQLYINP